MLVNSIRRPTTRIPIPFVGSPSLYPISNKNGEKEKEKQTKSLFRRAIAHFFSRPKSKLDLLKRLISAGIVSYAVFKSPALYLGLNNALSSSLLGITPKANAEGIDLPFTKPFLHKENFDNFVKHTDDFQRIHAAIHQSGIEDSQTLDLDKNGIILDIDDEYRHLIDLLERNKSKVQDKDQLSSYEASLKSLKETRELNKILWGKEGPKIDNINQVGGNCQIVADILGSCFTPENIQRLKSMVRVVDYNLNKKNFYIDCVVYLNGKLVEVKYNELRNWRQIKPKDAPEAPYIIAYAIEKELKNNYVPNPYTPSSAASTLLLRQDYSLLPTFALSDATLIQILRHAPYLIIKFGSYPEPGDYTGRIGGYFTGKTTQTEEEIKSRIRPYHEYVVKEVKFNNGETKVLVTTLNPDHNRYEEVELTIGELRSHMLTISAPNNLLPLFDSKTLQTYLISFALILLIRVGFIKLENLKKKEQPSPTS